jgi:hypothetical protein
MLCFTAIPMPAQAYPREGTKEWNAATPEQRASYRSWVPALRDVVATCLLPALSLLQPNPAVAEEIHPLISSSIVTPMER